MNEHPLDLHPEECKNFAADYMQATRAATRADLFIRQADILYKQAVTASKRADAAHRRSIAATKHAVAVQSTSQSATARRHAAAAILVACQLIRKGRRLWRLADLFSKTARAAGTHANILSNHVEYSLKTVFSGNKARLL